MRIKMLVIGAGSEGVLLKGSEHEMTEAKAEAFLKGGYAEVAKPKPAKPAPKNPDLDALKNAVEEADADLVDSKVALEKSDKKGKKAAGEAVAEAVKALGEAKKDLKNYKG